MLLRCESSATQRRFRSKVEANFRIFDVKIIREQMGELSECSFERELARIQLGKGSLGKLIDIVW